MTAQSRLVLDVGHLVLVVTFILAALGAITSIPIVMVILAISCSVSKLIAGISRGFLGVTIIAEGIIVSSMILAIDANF